MRVLSLYAGARRAAVSQGIPIAGHIKAACSIIRVILPGWLSDLRPE